MNLLRLGYKVAASFDASFIESEGYEYVFSWDDIDILELCGMGSIEEAGNIILLNKVDEEDYWWCGFFGLIFYDTSIYMHLKEIILFINFKYIKFWWKKFFNYLIIINDITYYNLGFGIGDWF